MKRGAAVVSWALCIGMLLPLCTGLAQEGSDAALNHIKEGLRQYDLGDLDKASASFEQALKALPSSAQALALLEQVDEQKIYRLLENEKTRPQALRLFKLAEKEEARKATDPAEIQAQIKDLGGDFNARWRAITNLVQIGDYAVPYILNLLDTEQPTPTTAAAQLALKKIGWRGVLPLIEALHSKSQFLKQNVCAVLANIGDVRAVPALKALVECPKEPAPVRLAAGNAIEIITGQSVGRIESAADLYYQLAEKYYYQDVSVMRHVGPITPVWVWKCCDCKDYTKCLIHFPEPDYAFNEIMAEHFCLAGLKCDPRHYKLRGLLSATYYSLISETGALVNGQMRPGLLNRQPTEEEQKEMQERLKRLDLWRNNAAANGSEFANAALTRALNDKTPLVALACIEGLRALDDDRPEGQSSALKAALRFREKMVRYAAAEALIHISPEGRLGDLDLTMRVVATALGENSQRTILLLEPNLQNRNRLKAILKSQPYHLIEADSMGKANRRILLGVPPIDLLLMAPEVGRAQTVTFARTLKASAEAIDMAIFVLADPKAVDTAKEDYGPAADAVLPADVSDKDLLAEIAKVCQQPAKKADDTAAVGQAIKRLCTVLTEIEPSNTKYPTELCAPALLELANDKDAEVRRLALMALGHAGRPTDRKTIMPIFADASCPKEVREAAGYAIENIMKRCDKWCTCCDPLVAIMGDPCPALAASAARAIGHSPAGYDLVVSALQTYQMVPLTPKPAAAAPAAAPGAAPAADKPAGKFADVKALMMCMKKNRDDVMAAMKGGDMKAVEAKLKALADLAACGKANFSPNEMLGKGYDMMKMACDEAAKAAAAGNAEALMAAAGKCKESCMSCHKNCRK